MLWRMLKGLCVLTIALLLTQQAFAVVFGQAKVRSHLGQPLDISIPLILSEQEALSKLHVALASPQEYKNLEQLLPKSYPFLRTHVVQTNPRHWDIQVTSSQAIDESFLTVILKVKRGRGHHFKKVQVFLDPEFTGHTQQNVKVPVVHGQTEHAQPTQQTITTSKVAMPGARFAGDWARRNSYGPVRYGDSLSEIAYRLRRDKRWSNRQVMLALYHQNPDAFVKGDINQLKKGSFLKVPDDQEMQAFVQSARYQELKRMLASHAVVQKTQKTAKQTKQPVLAQPDQHQPSYHGKVSLGLTESLDAPVVNAVVLSRLKKLEPLYKQAVETNLRVDTIDHKVDNLVDEVRALHKKVDALSQVRSSAGKGESTSYGWWLFMLLLALNVVLLLVYLYRKQMKTWQEKLKRAHQEHAYDDIHSNISTPSTKEEHQGIQLSGRQSDLMSSDVGGEAGQSGVEDGGKQATGYDNFGDIPAAMDEESLEAAINYTVAFEDAVHKQDWAYAQECFDKMDSTDQSRPRIQALYVQKLHGEGKLIDRNHKLLELFKLYDKNQWSRFCSSLDEDLWLELQEQGIINFTGNVVESAVERDNIAIKEQETEDTPVLDLSEADLHDISASDFPVLNDEDIDGPLPLDKVHSLENDISDKTVMMSAEELKKWGRIEEASHDVEPLEVDFEIGDSTEAGMEEGLLEVDAGEDDITADQDEEEPSLALDKEEEDDLLDNTVLRDAKTHQANIEKLRDKIQEEGLSFSFSDIEDSKDKPS